MMHCQIAHAFAFRLCVSGLTPDAEKPSDSCPVVGLLLLVGTVVHYDVRDLQVLRYLFGVQLSIFFSLPSSVCQ